MRGLKFIKFWRLSLRQNIQVYEYKTTYKSEYLFRMRKEVRTNYILKKADTYHRHYKIQKKYNIFIN